MSDIKIIRHKYDLVKKNSFIRMFCNFNYMKREIHYDLSSVRYMRNDSVIISSQFKSVIYFDKDTEKELKYYEEILYDKIIESLDDIKERDESRLENLIRKIEIKNDFIASVSKSYKIFHRKDKIKRIL